MMAHDTMQSCVVIDALVGMVVNHYSDMLRRLIASCVPHFAVYQTAYTPSSHAHYKTESHAHEKMLKMNYIRDRLGWYQTVHEEMERDV
jgi:hypothetical protein